MKQRLASLVLAVTLALGSAASLPARAHTETSALSTLSDLPIASVVVVGSAAAAAVVMVPVVLRY